MNSGARMFKSWFTTPSALTLAVRQLEEAKRQSLDAEARREHYEATAGGLKKTIARLQLTVQQLAKENDDASAEKDSRNQLGGM